MFAAHAIAKTSRDGNVAQLWILSGTFVSLFQQASTKNSEQKLLRCVPRCNRFLPECSQCPSLGSLPINVVWRGGHGGRQGCVGWHRTAREPRGSAAILSSALCRARDHIMNWTLSGHCFCTRFIAVTASMPDLHDWSLTFAWGQSHNLVTISQIHAF